jgi:uncharacterized protein YjbJ (UPF0337 family)
MADRNMRRDGAKNRAKGRVEELKGKVRGDIGDALDNREQHLKGRAEELRGKVRKGIGELQEDLSRDIDSDRI